jgi:hypothetical protein
MLLPVLLLVLIQAVSVSSSDNHRGYFSSLDHVELNHDPAALGKLKDNKEGFFFGSDTLIAPGNRVPMGCEDLRAQVRGRKAKGAVLFCF